MKQKKAILPLKNKKAVKAYEPTPQEREALTTYLAASKTKMPLPGMKLTEKSNDEFELTVNHPDQDIGFCLIAQAMASTSTDFLKGFMLQLSKAVSLGRKPDQEAINFALSVVEGVSPRDQLETLLAAQMAAVHMATMDFSGRLVNADNLSQRDSAERALNKLARTFAAQMETLKRYRTGGEQKVTVHHVTVNEGGQAIVGNVDRGEG